MSALLNLSPAPNPTSLDPFADDTPSSLYDLIEHEIGDLVGKLIADFGGQRLYIPIAPAPGDRVTSSIGLDAALAMARAFGGDRLVVPVTNDHARRRTRILAMRKNHVSVRRIAHQLRCSERYVYKVLAAEIRPRRHSRPDAPSQPPPRVGRPRNPSIVLTLAPPPERFRRGYINHAQ
jgi:Mor family transcriptional regulator